MGLSEPATWWQGLFEHVTNREGMLLHCSNQHLHSLLTRTKLNLLRTLVMWALSSSEIIQGIIKEKYKQNRHSEDENQPLSVQPWGTDVDKRRYFLIQGLDDSSFRVYREGSRYTKNAHWWSVAGTIDEVKALAEKLDKDDGSQAARRLSMKMINAIPMFEATEEVNLSLNRTIACMLIADITCRNDIVENTANRGVLPSRALSLGMASTKAVLVVNA